MCWECSRGEARNLIWEVFLKSQNYKWFIEKKVFFQLISGYISLRPCNAESVGSLSSIEICLLGNVAERVWQRDTMSNVFHRCFLALHSRCFHGKTFVSNNVCISVTFYVCRSCCCCWCAADIQMGPCQFKCPSALLLFIRMLATACRTITTMYLVQARCAFCRHSISAQL